VLTHAASGGAAMSTKAAGSAVAGLSSLAAAAQNLPASNVGPAAPLSSAMGVLSTHVASFADSRLSGRRHRLPGPAPRGGTLVEPLLGHWPGGTSRATCYP
jgi:hypothetical protein